MQSKRYVVTYTDTDGPHRSRPVSLGEANEQARQLRARGATGVHVTPANPPRAAGSAYVPPWDESRAAEWPAMHRAAALDMHAAHLPHDAGACGLPH